MSERQINNERYRVSRDESFSFDALIKSTELEKQKSPDQLSSGQNYSFGQSFGIERLFQTSQQQIPEVSGISGNENRQSSMQLFDDKGTPCTVASYATAQNSPFAQEKQRILELYRRQEGFRNEKAAIIDILTGRLRHHQQQQRQRQQQRQCREPREQPSACHNLVPERTIQRRRSSILRTVLRSFRRFSSRSLDGSGIFIVDDHQPGAVHLNYPALCAPEARPNFSSRIFGSAGNIDPLDSSLSFDSFQASSNLSDDVDDSFLNELILFEGGRKKMNTPLILAIVILVLTLILALILGFTYAYPAASGSTGPLNQQSDGNIGCYAADFSKLCHASSAKRISIPPCIQVDSELHSSSTLHHNISLQCNPSSLALLALSLKEGKGDGGGEYSDINSYYALAVFYYSTMGHAWMMNKGWLRSPNICSWYGVRCFPNSTLISELDLRRNGLHGTMPTEIGLLTSLTSLMLESNDIVATIPSEVGNLVSLSEFSLVGAEIKGQIPSELGNCQQLKLLHIHSTAIASTIPTEIGRLGSSLEILRLSGPLLSGSIPTELGALTKLREMMVEGKQLDEMFPTELEHLSALELLFISARFLEGDFISPLLKMSKLTKLWLAFKTQGSPFPTRISQLGSLRSLRVAGNCLTGQLPTELGLMTTLEELIISNQRELHGTIPTELGHLTRLSHLELRETLFSGTIPSELGRLSMLRHLNLEENRLLGAFPTEMCFLKSIPSFEVDICEERKQRLCIFERC